MFYTEQLWQGKKVFFHSSTIYRNASGQRVTSTSETFMIPNSVSPQFPDGFYAKAPNRNTQKTGIHLRKRCDEDDVTSMLELFSKNFRPQIVDTEKAKELVLLKYHKKSKEVDTNARAYGEIHILETSKDPRDVKYFFMDEPSMTGLYKRILILEKSILIELVNDPVANENFKRVMADNAGLIEQMGVDFIDTCTADSCLELSVPDVNLVPIAAKGNSLKLDALLHAGKVPESFKLKGFVEFEVAVDSPI